jgi:hypothetical protein
MGCRCLFTLGDIELNNSKETFIFTVHNNHSGNNHKTSTKKSDLNFDSYRKASAISDTNIKFRKSL